MATPTAMKRALSQQGRTPGQGHGAAATPPVSTPFSAVHGPAFSPRGLRSSPQQVKKSPAAATTGPTMGPPSNPAIVFDSPSASAAFGALPLDLGLDPANIAAIVGNLGKSSEDERAKRLDEVVAIISRKGVVSEAGLERLVKRLGLECIWEDGMGEESKRTLIVAGSALELIINLTNNMVTSVDLNFPDSGESVDKHAPASARILHQDLKLAPNQSPLTKKLDQFVPNFERLAILDRLSSNPGLNLYQAVAGLFVSLERLCQWELQNTRENPALAGKSDQFIKNLVLCTRSGFPAMNAGGRVGFSLEYWTENRLQPTATPRGECRPELWAIIIACGPLRDLAVNPVRISDKWISAEIVKAALPGNSQTGPILDWQEPENTFIQPQEQAKAPEGVGMHAGTSLLGPRLAEVVFTAVLDPPIHIPYSLWEQTRQLGCVPVAYDTAVRTFDSMLFPAIPGTAQVFKDDRVITRRREVHVFPPGMATSVRKFHANTLFVRKKVYGATLSELSFSHPQQVVSLLPYLRQYVFLATLLKNSFGEDENGSSVPGNQDGGIDELAQFPGPHGSPAAETAADWRVDIALFLDAMPRMRVVFPFRERMADVEVEIGENGSVHVVAQDVLDEKNTTAPNGRQRRPEDVGKLLETLEDIGEWCEWMSMRWA